MTLLCTVPDAAWMELQVWNTTWRGAFVMSDTSAPMSGEGALPISVALSRRSTFLNLRWSAKSWNFGPPRTAFRGVRKTARQKL
eukprot:3799495-Amphidinium_carterae.1